MAGALETYLTDHLAGADAAVDMLEKLADENDGELRRFFRELHDEVRADREQLEAVIEHFGFERGALRSAGARLAEKVSRAKLSGLRGGSAGGALHRLEALDGLQSGIEGKRALWRALDAAALIDPELAVADYAALAARAERQRERVDAVRLETARVALTNRG